LAQLPPPAGGGVAGKKGGTLWGCSGGGGGGCEVKVKLKLVCTTCGVVVPVTQSV